MKESGGGSKEKKDGLRGYLTWGVGAAIVSSIPGLIIAKLYTMGPEFSRPYKPEYFVPLVVLASLGFLAGCGVKYALDKHGK
jgi:hypothetical protein